MDYRKLFDSVFPGFFQGTRDMPESLIFSELILDLRKDDVNQADACPGGITFREYHGEIGKLREAVGLVDQDWAQYFDDQTRAFCAFDGDEIVSFCILSDWGAHDGLRIGGPGCVGTVPAYRRQGIGLETVRRATNILQEEGFDLSWIHYTHVGPWYEKLGYRTVLRWNGKGILPDELRLWHIGFAEIPQPDIHHGRRNADFGQGFYLSDDLDFSRRWARERRGMQTYINEYSLSLEGLNVKRFRRDAEWYDYITHNRAGAPDALAAYDVIMGPIANDTLYDTWGILTSGLISREKALYIYTHGPAYQQVVIKTEKAAAQLRWLSAHVMTGEEIAGYRAAVRQEEEEYQAFLAGAVGEIMRVLKD